jgi:hypothetical protein
MIEFSIAELALLIWAVAATAYAFEFKHRNHMAAMFITRLLDDPDFYSEYHHKFREQQKRRGQA